ncbi:MAG: tetratricopeptide repeat protein [Burkholderiales bacterium]|nr:tetratricopeptide repeat protein [Burkholderiales bacterium]
MRSLVAEGQLARALAAVDGGIEQFPDDPGLWHARGLALIAWSRYWEARAAFRRAEACGTAGTQVYIDAGWCSYMQGDLAEAERYQSKAVAAAPDCAEAHFALGVLRRTGREFAAALSCFDRVRALAPAYPDCALNVAMCEHATGNAAEAEARLRQALADNERDPRVWCMLGVVLMSQARHDEAFASFRRARTLELETGSDARSLAQQAMSFLDAGRAAEARELCEGALPASPDPSAHAHYAFALLTTGRFREGWQQYEFRWFEEPMRSARALCPQPVWSGQPLAGKTILVRAEQGFGDIIQFARYATPLKALGANVVMEVRDGIVGLARHFADVDRVLAKGEAFTAFDYYINMMSLPRVLATELSTIPANVPYVGVDDPRAIRWAQRIGDIRKLKVGLVWAGNPDHTRDRIRSIPLDRFRGLWRIPGVRYVSLQKVPRPGDAANMPEPSVMLDIGPELEDFADAAAIIDGLDLVVCVDTAIAHLAGAMGKPVWLLVPTVVDFRWMEDREDSPWYPTMRIFRQATAGDWDDVLRRVGESLRKAASGDESALRPPPSCGAGPGAAAVRMPDTAQRIARVTEARDGILQYLPELDAEARAIERYGEHLSAQLDILAKILPTDAHVVEVGSGIGAHALWFAKVLGPEAQIFLYEHRQIVRQLLSQNLEANGASQRATLVRGTLSRAGSEHLPPRDRPAHTLDDLRLGRLDLVKVEVPESAPDLVSGAEATLWRLRPKLLLAARDDRSLSELACRVKEFGYRCWRVETAFFNPRNFNRREDDIFDDARWLGMLAIPEEVEAGPELSTQQEM